MSPISSTPFPHRQGARRSAQRRPPVEGRNVRQRPDRAARAGLLRVPAMVFSWAISATSSSKTRRGAMCGAPSRRGRARGWVDVASGVQAGDKVVVEGNLHSTRFFAVGAAAMAGGGRK